jgi:hypothetical protein
MSDAITNLGGGGLDSPWLANLSTCLSYACSFLCTLIGGPLINKIGIKWSCFIAAVAMPLHGSAFYVDSKYDVDWFLLLGNVSTCDRTDTQDRRHADLCRSSKEAQPAFSTWQKPRPCCRTRSRRIGAFTLVCSS